MLLSGGNNRVSTAYLGLGSNLGEREKNLIKALSLLGQKTQLIKVSSIYETEPVGFKEQPLFLNIVCQVCTNLKPVELLHSVKQIEKQLGRKPSYRNSPRIIDIDILIYDSIITKEHDLIIPHPRLAERAFVLIPLAEIAPQLNHPELGKSILELANAINDKKEVRIFNKENL
jgi:2-amino-4-hydroxy-6-hydroxymethyldihydropteridine diphosphokinase